MQERQQKQWSNMYVHDRCVGDPTQTWRNMQGEIKLHLPSAFKLN